MVTAQQVMVESLYQMELLILKMAEQRQKSYSIVRAQMLMHKLYKRPHIVYRLAIH